MGHSRKDCISILMTTRCNLSCDYCYLTSCNLEGMSIDLNFAKEGIKDYFSSSKSRHIRFGHISEIAFAVVFIQKMARRGSVYPGEAAAADE